MSAFSRITTDTTVTQSRGVRIVSMIATAAITALDAVMLDTAQTGDYRFSSVKQAATSATGQSAACGVALDSATAAGQTVRVQVLGPLSGVNSVGLTIGLPCVVDATAGRLEARVAADHTCGALAIALGSTSSNATEVYLLDPLGLASV